MDKDSTLPKLPLATKRLPARRNFLATFFISFTWGIFGADRMYLGKWWTGILKLATVGGYGVWVLVDLVAISNGSMRDAWGRELHGSQEYQPFVNKFSLVVAVAGLFLAVIIGLTLFFAMSFAYQEMVKSGMFSLDSGFNIQDMLLGY